jgi:two-component system alkaline phosphatase synthesis response regulator PhoP
MDKKRILMIDDEENFCTLVKKNIELTNEFEVFIATNGEDGIKLAKELKPDLILLDIIMPDMDGADVITCIKNDKILNGIPVVILTAIAKGDESTPQADFAGGYALLSKTTTITELIACIKKNIR